MYDPISVRSCKTTSVVNREMNGIKRNYSHNWPIFVNASGFRNTLFYKKFDKDLCTDCMINVVEMIAKVLNEIS